MSPPSEGRPSNDRWRGDLAHGARSSNHQQQHDGSSSFSDENVHGSSNKSRQRHLDNGSGDHQLSNGSHVDNSHGGRYGREREQDNVQNLPIRERSRTNGSSGGKRICGRCGEPLLGQFVRAMGGMFHLECFMCRVRFNCMTH